MSVYSLISPRDHSLFIKARTREVLTLDSLWSNEILIHISEQAHLELVVPQGLYHHRIRIIQEKGSQLIIQERESWQGSLEWEVTLMEPYAVCHMVTRITCSEGQSLEMVKIHHEAEYTESRVDTRVVLSNQARLTQDVTLVVPKGRSGCKAFQSADVITFSSQARAHIIPRLEVSTDSAECSHGARIRTITERDVFYLMSRGIDFERGKQMILEGFLERHVSELQL